MRPNEDKRTIKAPCVYIKWNEEKKRQETAYPSVNCGHQCESCGFNPAEQARRLETGKFVKRLARINVKTEKLVILPDGVVGLRFPRGEATR